MIYSVCYGSFYSVHYRSLYSIYKHTWQSFSPDSISSVDRTRARRAPDWQNLNGSIYISIKRRCGVESAAAGEQSRPGQQAAAQQKVVCTTGSQISAWWNNKNWELLVNSELTHSLQSKGWIFQQISLPWLQNFPLVIVDLKALNRRHVDLPAWQE